MTEKESKTFQIKTIILAALIAALVNLGFVSFDYSRSDSKDVDARLDKKLDKEVYEKDKSVMLDKDSKQAEFNMEIKATLTGIGANTQWLVDEYKRRNK